MSVLPKGATPPVLPAGTMPPMPLVHLAFGTGPTFYMSHALFILDYEPPCGFVISAFATFGGATISYDHMLHYNKAMILNAGNDRLLCKVFSASL